MAQKIYMENTEKFDSPVYETAYSLNKNGVKVRELELCGKGKGEVTVAMITDSHLRDDEGFITALKNAIECASAAKQIVLCGDSIESTSNRKHVELLKEMVWDPYPETVCVLGNHELFYGDEADNRAHIEKVWPHDPYYYSKVLDDSVMIIAADDNKGYFVDAQCDKFEKDISFAREKGLAVLFFHHISAAGYDRTLEANDRMYNIIKASCDVITACFSGHHHVDQYKEIECDGGRVIPCYKLEACHENGSCGNVLFITVK